MLYAHRLSADFCLVATPLQGRIHQTPPMA